MGAEEAETPPSEASKMILDKKDRTAERGQRVEALGSWAGRSVHKDQLGNKMSPGSIPHCLLGALGAQNWSSVWLKGQEAFCWGPFAVPVSSASSFANTGCMTNTFLTSISPLPVYSYFRLKIFPLRWSSPIWLQAGSSGKKF